MHKHVDTHGRWPPATTRRCGLTGKLVAFVCFRRQQSLLLSADRSLLPSHSAFVCSGANGLIRPQHLTPCIRRYVLPMFVHEDTDAVEAERDVASECLVLAVNLVQVCTLACRLFFVLSVFKVLLAN